MAKWNGRIIFLDGFAGPGRYVGGEEGSPLIALRALLEHPHMTPLPSGAEIRFHFVEERKDRLASLEAEIANFKAAHPLPQGVHAHVAHDRFDAYLGNILDGLEKAGRQIAPTFAFIDPFGFSGVPMELVHRLGANPKCEVLISFIYESITRWAAHPDPKIQAHLDDLFGTREWRAIAAEADPDRRRDGLVELYRRQLMAANFPYVLEFELRDKGNRPHGSRRGDGTGARGGYTPDRPPGPFVSFRVVSRAARRSAGAFQPLPRPNRGQCPPAS
jgi:three-Cys-motif partner protein